MTETCRSCERLDDLLLDATDHIAALETTSRALAAKLEECGPYLPHGSVRDELDALIAVLKETK